MTLATKPVTIGEYQKSLKGFAHLKCPEMPQYARGNDRSAHAAASPAIFATSWAFIRSLSAGLYLETVS